MKYPKYRLAFPGKHVWVFNGHPMTQFNGYKLNTTAIGNGVVSADKSRGYYGESAQIFLSAAPYSTFSALSAQYGTIDGMTYYFGKHDDILSAYFYGDPYNPLNLPPNTMRVRTNDGNVPYKNEWNGTSYETATLVPGTTDVYDVYKSGTNFNRLLSHSTNVVEVLGANTTGITNMDYMFDSCTSLSTVPLFNTSNVTSMSYMFNSCTPLQSVPLFDTSNVTNISFMLNNCRSLSAVPLFDTSNVTNMDGMFYDCYKVESGALALYQQASTQTNPPTEHSLTFYYCGSDTQTGSAELAQIPSDWK